ncbi:MAG: UDP-glucose 4-epimerase GalE [Chlorobi bacterium]|nr:UDP-glucose 4-epimerase GalE [Chlorobiota bacterium]
MKRDKEILLTGGLGFIGSHTAVALLEAGYMPVIADDLSNTRPEVLDGIEKITGVRPPFYPYDLRDAALVKDIFDRHPRLEGIIHFAASKYVNESVENPLKYYENNLCSLIHLLKEAVNRGTDKFIFSSSCTVYGLPDTLPVTEETPVKPAVSPYGNTKQIGEEILTDTAKVHDLKVILLRYFNPIGAHPSAEIGELPVGVPQNLVPFITQTAAGLHPELRIFGDDYDTPDGTAIRDYIHVMDLARAHVEALKYLEEGRNKDKVEIFNVGTGRGHSVMEIVRTFKEVTGAPLPYRIAGRREGDVPAIWADNTKIRREMGWEPRYTIADALRHAWAWEKKIRGLEE